ncbi:MAG: 30S ribosome-binding factor RbfA [Nitrospirota bacterium]|nr:30S ribosome-binding factor RbfA [Nitrospirota bacterium]
MLPYKRSQRVGDLVREEVAEIIMYRLKDPRIGFITVTGAEMTPDLKLARVFVSVFKEDERELTLEILNSAKGFMRSILRKRLKMKFVPDIEFRLDKSIEYGDRIDRLLNKISRPATPEPPEGQGEEKERRGGDEGS